MGTMPDPDDQGAPGEEQSEYRFVVLGHPELGEFWEMEAATAAAWEVTSPGGKRPGVTLAHQGTVQVRTEDPTVWLRAKVGTSYHSVKHQDDTTATLDCGQQRLLVRSHLTTETPDPGHTCYTCVRAREKRTRPSFMGHFVNGIQLHQMFEEGHAVETKCGLQSAQDQVLRLEWTSPGADMCERCFPPM